MTEEQNFCHLYLQVFSHRLFQIAGAESKRVHQKEFKEQDMGG
jgi:hypothetical protein